MVVIYCKFLMQLDNILKLKISVWDSKSQFLSDQRRTLIEFYIYLFILYLFICFHI